MCFPPRNTGASATGCWRAVSPTQRIFWNRSRPPIRTFCWFTSQEYVHKLKTGTLSPREEMEMEIPYSRELVEAFWLAAGGSILAARQALSDGVGISIGGGFHHAFPDHGEGFCMIHDVAVAIRRLQRDDKIRTAMTVDCDVHQGNGTAAIFAGTRTASEPLPSAGASTVDSSARSPRSRARCAEHMPGTSSPSRCISTTTIRCGSRRHPLTWTCPMASETTTTWPGSTTRSVPGCGSSSLICCATSPAPTRTAKTNWAGFL